MAQLKRNFITLIKNPEGVNKGDEPEFEKVWTPAFLSLRVAQEASSMYLELIDDDGMKESDKFDKLADFVANKIFMGKITKDDIYDRMHSPGFEGFSNAKDTLEQQVLFAANGQQSNETRDFLKKKKGS